jgi:hypothetical protein
MLTRTTRVLAVIGIAILTTGSDWSCSYGDNDSGSSGEAFATSLLLRDANGTPQDRFRLGESITFELTVRNRRDFSVTAQFADGRQSDFVVLERGTNRVLWKWSDGRSFTQQTSQIVFAPNETRRFRVDWNQLTASGTSILPGRYDARGALVFAAFDADPRAPSEFGSDLATLNLE